MKNGQFWAKMTIFCVNPISTVVVSSPKALWGGIFCQGNVFCSKDPQNVVRSAGCNEDISNQQKSLLDATDSGMVKFTSPRVRPIEIDLTLWKAKPYFSIKNGHFYSPETWSWHIIPAFSRPKPGVGKFCQPLERYPRYLGRGIFYHGSSPVAQNLDMAIFANLGLRVPHNPGVAFFTSMFFSCPKPGAGIFNHVRIFTSSKPGYMVKNASARFRATEKHAGRKYHPRVS